MQQVIKYLLFSSIAINFFGGCKTYSSCEDIAPTNYIKSNGCFIYRNTSQDGQRDLYFFPICSKNENLPIDSNFINLEFKKGIQIKLSITSDLFKKISENSTDMKDYHTNDPEQIFICLATVEFENVTNSNPSYSATRSEEHWELTLSNKTKNTKLKYFVSNNSVIKGIDFYK